jgi:glycosyltransferase involved in cell wall biosynthesis
MKIAYLLPGLGISGGVGVVLQHVNRLKERGYDVVLLSQNGDTKADWFPNLQVECYFMLDYKEEIDLLIATGWSTVFDVAGINSKYKGYFVQSDETRFFEKGSIHYHLAVLSYLADFYFFTEALWIQKWLKENFNKDAWYVPNGLDTEIFHQVEPLAKKRKPRILLEGPIDIPYKGMQEAFEIVSNIKEEIEVWCISSAGKPKSNWRCDKFFEKVNMQDMKDIYSSCDILIKTSKVEGFFGLPLEMMSCGGVSLVFKVTGYDEYIVHEENALVANAGDVEGAAKLLSDLINDKEKFERLKLNGKETVKFWTWDRSIDYLEMYIKDISNKKIVESNIINNTLNYSYYNLLGNNTLNITIDNTVDVHIYEALKKKPFILKVIRKMFIYMKNVRNFLR